MSTGLSTIPDRPTFLVEQTDREGTEGLKKIVRPSMVKIVQKMSADELLSQFGMGSMILTPDQLLLSKFGEENGFPFVPILHWIEWCKWTSIRLKGQESMIKERTLDDRHPLAKLCQNEATWVEMHPQYPNDPKYAYRNCEHLNFLVQLWDPDLRHMDPVLVSFVRSNHSMGRRLGKMILNRQASIYAGVYRLFTKNKKGTETDYPAFGVANNSDDLGAWVDSPEAFKALQERHHYFADLYRNDGFEAGYDEAVVVDPSDVVEAGGGPNQFEDEE